MDLDREALEAHLNRLSDEGKAPRTVNRHLVNVKAMMNWAVDTALLPFNPLASVKALPQHEKRVRRRSLSLDEMEKLLNSAQRPNLVHGSIRPMQYIFIPGSGGTNCVN